MKKPRMLHHRHHIIGTSFEFEFLQPCGNKVSSRWCLSTSYINNLQSTAFALGEVCPCLENVVIMQSHSSSLLYVWTLTKRNEVVGASSRLMVDDYMTCLWPCWRVTGMWECHPLSDYCWTLVKRSWDPTSPNIFFSVNSDLPASLRGEGSHRRRAQEWKYSKRWMSATNRSEVHVYYQPHGWRCPSRPPSNFSTGPTGWNREL